METIQIYYRLKVGDNFLAIDSCGFYATTTRARAYALDSLSAANYLIEKLRAAQKMPRDKALVHFLLDKNLRNSPIKIVRVTVRKKA